MRNCHSVPTFIWISRKNIQKKSHKHFTFFILKIKHKKARESTVVVSIKSALMRHGIICQLTQELKPTLPARHIRRALHQTSQFVNLINEFSNVIFLLYAANIFLLFSYTVLTGLTLSVPAWSYLRDLSHLMEKKKVARGREPQFRGTCGICLSIPKISMLTSYF